MRLVKHMRRWCIYELCTCMEDVTQLVASKTRVVPVKKQSIPMLELLGAVILARLVNCIRKAITSLPVVPKVIL